MHAFMKGFSWKTVESSQICGDGAHGTAFLIRLGLRLSLTLIQKGLHLLPEDVATEQAREQGILGELSGRIPQNFPHFVKSPDTARPDAVSASSIQL
jgi:hypothetical protein